MSAYDLKKASLSQILNKHHLGDLVSVKEIAAGLINPAYLINENLVLRIDVEKYDNPNKFRRESALYGFLPNFDIPTPKLVAFDDSKALINEVYLLIEYISGENLLDSFHGYSLEQKKSLSFQLGELVHKIHSVPVQDIPNRELFGEMESWLNNSVSDFGKQWAVVKQSEYLNEGEINDIESVFQDFSELDLKDVGKLTHGDFSPSNIQVKDGKIVGIFDFEYAFVADPFWDLQKLPISFQLGSDFYQKEFLRGYSRSTSTDKERLRLKMYSLQQGVWEIWATITNHMEFSDKEIQEGLELIRNAFKMYS